MDAQSIVAIVASIAGILSTLVTVICHTISKIQDSKIKARVKRDEIRKRLSLQLVGYYYEEQILISKLSEITGTPELTIKKEMRKAAQNHAENIENVYPDMTATKARDYIS